MPRCFDRDLSTFADGKSQPNQPDHPHDSHIHNSLIFFFGVSTFGWSFEKRTVWYSVSFSSFALALRITGSEDAECIEYVVPVSWIRHGCVACLLACMLACLLACLLPCLLPVPLISMDALGSQTCAGFTSLYVRWVAQLFRFTPKRSLDGLPLRTDGHL